MSEILQEAQRGGEDRRTSHRFLATTHSLITDQEEPSAMRRAAEFGNRLQPPDQVSSRVEREDLSQRSAPVASGGDKTRRTTLPPLAGPSTTSSGTANTTVTLPNPAGGSTRMRGREQQSCEGWDGKTTESKPDCMESSALTTGDTTSPEVQYIRQGRKYLRVITTFLWMSI